jgi:sialate O-acetylesterase
MLRLQNSILLAGVLVLSAFWVEAPAKSAIHVCPLFQDNAVLQRDHSILVFGTGDDGDEARVSLAGQSTTAVVSHGHWKANLHSMPAGGPYELKIDAKSGQGSVTAENVMIGEVWLCSGQSNMYFPLSMSAGGKDEVARAADSNLRLFKISSTPSAYPQSSFSTQCRWDESAPASASHFSAVAYFFGKELREDVKVPVGIIEASWGGTIAESWTDAALQKKTPALSAVFDSLLARNRKDIASYPERLAEYNSARAKYDADAANAYVSGIKPGDPPKPPIDPRQDRNAPGFLYNSYIAPIATYQVAGVLWYQGEQNQDRGGEYEEILSTLIDNWRNVWNEGYMPFLIVQLPRYNASVGWVEVREAQRQVTLKKAEVAIAVTYDTGDAKNIHPTDKRTVADRLSLLAKKMVYSEPVECSGPSLVSASQTGDGKIRVVFDHADGLTTNDGSASVKGVALAGSDGKFHDASAHIEGNAVIAQSPDVLSPLWVRYNWLSYPHQALINSAKLPASPFRTDRLPLVTIPK